MSVPIDAVRWVIILLTCIALAVAAVNDVRYRRIQNLTVLALIVLFGAWFLVEPSASLASSLAAGFIVFAGGFVLYWFKIVGAGDSKLATVVALFAGLRGLPHFVVYMTLAGGVLALCMLAAQPTRVMVLLHVRGRGHAYRGVPYGVAIAVAGAISLLTTALRSQS